MERVTVAELKSKLSHYLREVRAGTSFTVVSRDIPVATLGPYEPDEIDDLVVIEATEDPATWGQIDLPPLGPEIDVVALLRQDRDDRDDRLDALVREWLEHGDAEPSGDGDAVSPGDGDAAPPGEAGIPSPRKTDE